MTIPHHEHRMVTGGQARATVFGLSDGLVSNISLVLGFAGSQVDASLVRLAGIAGLLAGASSMAAGEYVSVKAQNELIERELEVEKRELARNPESETAELARMYERKGIPRHRARQVAADIMRRPELALDVHVREELGVDPSSLASPAQAAGFSFLAFALGAILPVIPWFFTSGGAAIALSLAIGVAVATVVGLVIGRFAERHVGRAVARQVGLLVLACSVTFAVGRALGVTVT